MGKMQQAAGPEKPERIKIPFRSAISMATRYIRRKIGEQVSSVAFIVIYLFLFQLLIVGSPAGKALQIVLGILFVILGLTSFMEGLVLGLMPLGEGVGLMLPRRGRVWQLLLFGLAVGYVATLAEPAISALQSAGSGTSAWESPLLYYLLEMKPGLLVTAIGAGVGLAVALSLIRYIYDISLKPCILILLPVVLTVTLVFSFDRSLSAVIGLAWDSGAVTTGPVTVPLVLALGMGVARSTGKQGGTAGGFGTVALASLLPVLTVMLAAAMVVGSVPRPMAEAAFFSAELRKEVLPLFPDEHSLERYAFVRGSAVGRRSWFADEQAYHEALASLLSDSELLGGRTLAWWMQTIASEEERSLLEELLSSKDLPVQVEDTEDWTLPGILTDRAADGIPLPETDSAKIPAGPLPAAAEQQYFEVIREEGISAVRAVLPLTGMLLLVLVGMLREKLRYRDEFVLGVFLTLAGMLLLTTGIRLGLVPLGDAVGKEIPKLYRSAEREETHVVSQFDPEVVYEAIGLDGTRSRFFYLQQEERVTRIPYNPEGWDPITGTYTYVRVIPPMFGHGMTLVGVLFVLIFAFGLGYGSTLAEPALNALGRNAEEISVGTVTKQGVIRAVSIGVGIGLVIGILRLVYAVPTVWLVLPAYLLLIPLTIWGEQDFTGIAWDSGGATTGPVTVPLVLAMGLGISGSLGLEDGFGVLASASVFPILTVQIYGILVRVRQRRSARIGDREGAADE